MSRLMFALFFVFAVAKAMTGSDDVSQEEFDSKLSSVVKINWYDTVCTGIAIHKNWILTSAYCMTNNILGQDLAARMGGMQTSMYSMRTFNITFGRTVKVFDPKHPDMPMMYMKESVIKPAEYQGRDRTSDLTVADIALIHLGTPLNETLYKIAQLPTDDVITKVNMTKCTAASWGKIVGPSRQDADYKSLPRSESVPKTLQEVAMSKVDSCYWDQKNQYFFTDKHFCATQAEGKYDGYRGPCDQDLGSPLVCEAEGGKSVLVGLSTLANSCDESGIQCNSNTVVFTKVRKYMDWITSVH